MTLPQAGYPHKGPPRHTPKGRHLLTPRKPIVARAATGDGKPDAALGR
jgi:hypothetical protein